MKAVIKFNLDEDMYEYKIFNKAMDMKIAIEDFEDMLRSLQKYDSPHFDNKDDMLEHIRNRYHNILGEYLND